MLISPLLMISLLKPVFGTERPSRSRAAWCASLLFTQKNSGRTLDRGAARYYLRALFLNLKKRLDDARAPTLYQKTRSRLNRFLDPYTFDPERPHDFWTLSFIEPDAKSFDDHDSEILGRLAALEEGSAGLTFSRLALGLSRGSAQIQHTFEKIKEGREWLDAKLPAISSEPRWFGIISLDFDHRLVGRGLLGIAGTAAGVGIANFIDHDVISPILTAFSGGLLAWAVKDILTGVWIFNRDHLRHYGRTSESRNASTIYLDLFELEVIEALKTWRPGYVFVLGFSVSLPGVAYAALNNVTTINDIESKVLADMIFRDMGGNEYSGAEGVLGVDLMLFADPETAEPIFISSLYLDPKPYRDGKTLPRRSRKLRKSRSVILPDFATR